MAAGSWWMWSHLCRMSAECLLVSLVCGVGVKSVDMNINCAQPATPPPTCLARQIPEEAVTSEWYTYHNIHTLN